MRKLLLVSALVVSSSAVAVIAPASALACDTSYWNVGCQYYSVGESHSAYPGTTPHNITIRASADPAKWVAGKTRQFVSTAVGSWVQTNYAVAPDDSWLTYVSFSNSRGGCVNSLSFNGTIWINCATHLWG
jgi:hypothetical protein